MQDSLDEMIEGLADEEREKLAEGFERVGAYLDKYGWIQFDYGFNGGARCLVGAMYSVVSELELHLLKDITRACTSHNIAIWNDDPSRTADEVINLCYSLANKLR